jgi:hypothetical protein
VKKDLEWRQCSPRPPEGKRFRLKGTAGLRATLLVPSSHAQAGIHELGMPAQAGLAIEVNQKWRWPRPAGLTKRMD